MYRDVFKLKKNYRKYCIFQKTTFQIALFHPTKKVFKQTAAFEFYKTWLLHDQQIRP